MAQVEAAMKAVETQVRTCQLCRLARTRTMAVPGEGNTRAAVMLIGEGPGYHEDKQGRPFVGPAGQFLNELLGIAGLSRESVFIANVVKCRPPQNRDPLPDEIAACAPYLARQIAHINPRVVVTLGRYSMAQFFPGERISRIHGTARMIEGRMCVAMYHPAAGLHQASLADVIRADFRRLPIYIEQAGMVSRPAGEAAGLSQRLVEAGEAREAVVREPETSRVLEEPIAYRTTSQPESVARQAQPVAETEAAVPAEASPPSTATAGRRKRPATATNEYKQLSFFDV